MVATKEELITFFVVSIVGFSGALEACTWILRSVLEYYPGLALDKKHIPTLITQGPSYITSMVHCILNSYRGIQQLYGLYHAPTDVKLFFPPTPQEFEPYIRNVELSNAIFAAYLLFDLIHIVRLYPKLGGADMVAHHLVFLICAIINGSYGILAFPFSWLIIGEISTLFLDIRWFLIKTGRGDTQFFQWMQYLFATSFFCTRVVIYSAGVLELFGQRSVLRDLVANGHVPGFFMGTTLLFIGAGCLLNLFWFQKIAAMAFSTNNKKPKKEA